MKKVKNQTISYKMNMTEEMVNQLINKVEMSKRDAMMKQSQLQQDISIEKDIYEKVIAEAEERWNNVRVPYEELQKVIDFESRTLEALVRFKQNTSSNKEIGVYNTISNTHKKVRGKGTSGIKVKWREAIPALLKRLQQFKDVKTLVAQTTSDIAGAEKAQSLPKTYFWSAANYVRNMAINNEAGLVMYNDKIGLQEWTQTLTEKAVPKPEFLNGVMG